MVFYVGCWTEDTGMFSCVHEHPTVADAMNCLIPNGTGFIRAVDGHTFRSLDEAEWLAFVAALPQMPWSRATREAAKAKP